MVLCTVCKLVSHWHGHVRGWEESMVSKSSGFGSRGLCSEISKTALKAQCISHKDTTETTLNPGA
jgi:hypothetical protein